MKMLLHVFAIVVMVALAACGGGGTANQFDSQDLNDHRAEIQSNADNAGIVIAGTITTIGAAPEFWSGVAVSTQAVTYTVDTVLKGTYTESGITINHILLDGSRQAAIEPGLNTAIFAQGARLIIFLNQNSDFESLEGYEGPLYIDVDPEYGAIPWSSQNQGVVENMIANPSASEIAPTASYARATPSLEKTLTMTGSDADVASFNALLDACKGQSSALSSLVDQITNSTEWDATLNIVRSEARVFVDSWDGRKVDIKDLEDWHEGCNQKTDRCQLFGHILQEYWHAAVSGDGYAPSHASAIQTENQIRGDLGKTTTLTGHWGVNNGGNWSMETTYGDYTELVAILAGSNVGGVTVVASPPAAPTNLTVNDSVSCQLTVSWTNNASDETGFDLYRKTGTGGTWDWMRELAADTTSYVNAHADDSTLTLGETYCYRVRAWKTVDTDYVYSDYSNEACGTKK